jgi:hypothetical protein
MNGPRSPRRLGNRLTIRWGGRFVAARWCLVAIAIALTLAARGADETSPATQTPIRRFMLITPTPRRSLPGQPLVSIPDTYVVQPGDTLALIAIRFSVTEDALQRLNHLDDPDSVYAGQQLLIPQSSPN